MTRRVSFLYFIALFCCLSKNAYGFKIGNIDFANFDFNKNIYGKLNANIGYNLQTYGGGMNEVFELAKNSAIDYKMNKADHALNIGVGYNFYLDFTNTFHPFVGVEATVRIPLAGLKTLQAKYDREFGSMLSSFGAGDSYNSYVDVQIPTGTAYGIISSNTDGTWHVTYYDRSNAMTGEEDRNDFVQGTINGNIQRNTGGTWVAHLNNTNGYNYDMPKYTGHWSPSEETENSGYGYTLNLKMHEYLMFDLKFGCKIFFNNNIALSPYYMMGLNIAQAQVNIALHDRNISNKVTTAGFITGVGVEAVIKDRYSITIEYRHSINKFNFSSHKEKLDVSSNNLGIKFGYYFL